LIQNSCIKIEGTLDDNIGDDQDIF